jgi:hypothetical protein
MAVSFVMLVVLASGGVGQAIRPNVVTYQEQSFDRWWDEEFVWTLADLPKEGSVTDERIPYSGYIYPDNGGGTAKVLQKYDRAFHGGKSKATDFERRDTSGGKPIEQMVTERYGWRGRYTRTRLVRSYGVPHWYGHCNGWTSAAIRHAEPKKSVVRNGVEFTPADIKALLAEIYMYVEADLLDGGSQSINPGTFHAILANWIGRGKHPVGMEADPGREKWNYPIYKYRSTIYRRSAREVEVRTNITYAANSRGEMNVSPRIARGRYFHYSLTLDEQGKITGGRWYRDSSQLDMLWIPLQPKPGGTEGNKRGNPHIDIEEVLAIWRESAPEEVRSRWAIVDPHRKDRLFDDEQLAQAAQPRPEANAAPEPASVPNRLTASETPSTPTTETTAATGGTPADSALAAVAAPMPPGTAPSTPAAANAATPATTATASNEPAPTSPPAGDAPEAPPAPASPATPPAPTSPPAGDAPEAPPAPASPATPPAPASPPAGDAPEAPANPAAPVAPADTAETSGESSSASESAVPGSPADPIPSVNP